MPKDYRKEISFQAGELSPIFYGRSETEFYQKGLAIAENVTVDKRGGVFRRGGATNRGQISGNDGRLFTKQVHSFRFDTINLHDSEMVLVAPGIDFASANLFTNPKFLNGGTSWTITATTPASRAIFANSVCKLKPQQNEGTQQVLISQQVTVTASPSANHIVRIQQAKSTVLAVTIGTTIGAFDIGLFFTNKEEDEFVFVPNNATYWVNIISDGANSVGSELVFAGTIAEADKGGLGKLFVAPWTEDQLDEIHVVNSPDGNTLYFLHPNVTPHKLTYDFATDVYTGITSVVFTAAPAAWTGTNFPATGVYAAGRLWLLGTPNEPQTGWGSKSGSPEDFTTGAGAADSWNFTIEEQGRVKWAIKVGKRDILIGTENGEHILTSQDGVISQLDFDISRQSSYGSGNIQAIQVGDKIFYVTPDGRKVQSTSYDWQEDNWLSQDLTFASEHVSKGIINRRAWAQNPDALFVARLENGEVVILTYDRTSDTLGWTRQLYVDMSVIDVAVGTIGGTSRIVFLTQRTVDEIELEVETSEKIYMDSYAAEVHVPASDTVSGLDHLEGEEVQVVIDGAVSAPQTVTGGAITTASAGIILYAGKQISSKITTLPPDVPQDSIRSWLKRWNKVWALMHLSAPPIINGVRPPDRSPATPMDTPEPLSSTQHKAVNLGWDQNGQITIEENLPVPMNVLAIYGELSRETL